MDASVRYPTNTLNQPGVESSPTSKQIKSQAQELFDWADSLAIETISHAHRYQSVEARQRIAELLREVRRMGFEDGSTAARAAVEQITSLLRR